MPTLAGMRRRGITPEALRAFADLIGVAKNNSTVDIGKFEFAIRSDLEARSPRALAVLDPLPVTLTSWPAGTVETLQLPWWPAEPARGSRPVPCSGQLLIERDDFSLDPPADWKRLCPGGSVRLAGGWVIRCDEVLRDEGGAVTGLRCSHDPSSFNEGAGARRGLGTIHWVDAASSVVAPVRLYDRLFAAEQPDAEPDFLAVLNPASLVVAGSARLEPALAAAAPGDRFQFLRLGYFFADPIDSRPGAPVFNRTITLRDTWTRPAAQPEPRRAPRPRADPAPDSAPRKGRGEARAERRTATPALAERYARYQQALKLPEEQADLLTGDLALAGYFDAAVAAGGAPTTAARWLLNDLLGLAGEAPLESLQLVGAGFGAFVALVDAGKLTPAGGKALLGDLLTSGGDPAARMKALGLEKVEDAGALAAAVTRALDAQSAEVARYRAGEKKLLGVLLGAAMREARGSADAAAVRAALLRQLG
jgi:glutaminyl-tRNA synthetase